MQNPNNEDLRLRLKINAIQNSKHITQQQKIHQIALLKAAIPPGQDPSSKTVIGIMNCMIGSAMIIYPILFVKSGIIISPLVMLVVASVQYVTCRLLVLHNRPDEPTYNQSILRIGGARVDRLNSVVNMLLFFFVCVAYFILITHNFYQVSSAVLAGIFPYNPPSSSAIVFSKYSIQWAAVLVAFAVKPILFRREIDFVLKLMNYAIYCIIAYAIFILFNLLRHIIQGNIHLSQFRYFNSDFSSVAGAFALSFLVHPMAAPILKRNINLNNNNRDLFFGYVLGAGVCFYVGFMGGLSCAPEVSSILKNPGQYSTIFDCLASTKSADDRFFYIASKIVQLGILYQNFAVLPIIIFLTRNEFINIAAKPSQRDQYFKKFTWFYLIFSLIVALLAIDVSIILSLDGAVIGFFMGYGIPIYIHLRCLYHSYSPTENKRRKSLLQSLINESILGEDQHQLQLQPQALECNPHDREKESKIINFMIYGGMLAIGIALGCFKLMAVFG